MTTPLDPTAASPDAPQNNPCAPPSSGLLQKIAQGCRKSHPFEACGLWWREDSIERLHIFAPHEYTASPTHFAIPAQTLLAILQHIEQAQGTLCGWFHSHPSHPPHPSQRDIASWWTSSQGPWFPQAQLLLLSPSNETYAWALYAPTQEKSFAPLSWGDVSPTKIS
ncbi:MAG: Mov34/MPN/PAD-1 family protein [Myxococcales bacterium]|nr:Mov34/MPN/PAD-1 family protein [Myxococcales bacterium]MCB9642906.1 Mov34/MPN/PAD-1 family protein [Myxococcales bacterium]